MIDRSPLRRFAFRLALCAGLVMAAAAAYGQEKIETPAKQAFIVDFETDAVLLAKNADEPMPPSSMSKLMTAYMIFERLAAGTLKFEDTFTVSENAWRRGGAASGGSTMFLAPGAKVTIADLLRGVIVQSGNDACIVLAEGYAGTEERFAEMMNKRARELGLRHSKFKNSTGLPDPEHVMTAREIAQLAKLVINNFPQYYTLYNETEFTYGGIKQGNRNPLLYKNMGADGLKTGHTEAAGYGLAASAKRGDRRLILVVNGLRSMAERSRESERLMEIGFREFDNYKLFTAGNVVDNVDVWLGAAPTVEMAVSRDVVVTMPRRLRPKIKVTLAYDNPAPAPIRRGAPLGLLRIDIPESQPIELPVVASADVAQLDFVGRIRAALGHLMWGGGAK